LDGPATSLLLVADDAERLLETPAETALCDLLRNPPAHLAGFVVAGSADAFAASFRPLAAAVRRCRAAVLLGPPAGSDVELVGRRIERDRQPPPGRGVLILGSQETPIQLVSR
jgi:S-DNA-T family DNA segregation ATPase FtsK/SpoIIIE